MALLLYINGQLADLDAGTVIAQTKQVNDLNSLDDRQTNYTNKFKLPKTANNVRIMQFLTLPGNNSPVPYQKNECSLYSHTGECFVYKGRAVVTDGGDSYDAVVYDGIIDLYKAIENKTLADLGLEELRHEKTTSAIANTWNGITPYRYIMADYNGNSEYSYSGGIPQCNIDYMVPSVNVQWLFNRIFSFFGFEPPQGAIFSHEDFTNLWVTFPKGAQNNGENDTTVFLCSEINPRGTHGGDYQTFYMPYANPSIQLSNVFIYENRHIRVSQSGHYRIEFRGTLKTNKNVEINVGRNCHTLQGSNNMANRTRMALSQASETEFEYQKILHLTANDTVSIIISNGSWFDFYDEGTNAEVKLVQIGTKL